MIEDPVVSAGGGQASRLGARWSAGVWLALLLTAAAACPAIAQSPGADPAGSPVPAEGPAFAVTGDLPAVGRLSAEPETLPRGVLGWSALHGGVVDHDGQLVGLGLALAGRGVAGPTYRTVAVIRSAEGTWTVHPVDDLRGFRRPPGRPTIESGVQPVAIAANEEGVVAIGGARFRTPSYASSAAVGVIWQSENGRTWRRVDPRSVIGQGSVALGDVVALPGSGYLVAGSAGPLDGRGKTDAVVLGSDDGRRWRRMARIPGTWSISPQSFHVVGDQIVLAGLEYICDSGNSHQTTFSLSGQLRLWQSGDRGRTWALVDLSGVTAITPPEGRAPVRPGGCPRSVVNQFASDVASIGSAGGLLTLLSEDGATVSSTRDLIHWNHARLPGATPPDGDVSDRDIRSTAWTTDATGAPALLSLEAWRRADDRPSPDSAQVHAWRTEDDGVTWQRWAPPAPFLPAWDPVITVVSPDRALLIENPPVSAQRQPPAKVTLGSGGPVETWGTCEPGPGADCRYATIEGVALAGADLTGIDLSFATVAATDLTGATLREATLQSARFGFDAPIAGADLGGADVRGALIYGDATGVTLDGAIVRGARGVPLEALPVVKDARDVAWVVPAVRPDGLDLRGRKLGRAQFEAVLGATKPGDLRNLDVRGTELDGSTFYHVDLTGTDLARAKWRTLTFLGDTICPDGKPIKDDAFGAEACRLKPR
jgi:uncharacterized protein YjbI with pentapeptide repeats